MLCHGNYWLKSLPNCSELAVADHAIIFHNFFKKRLVYANILLEIGFLLQLFGLGGALGKEKSFEQDVA